MRYLIVLKGAQPPSPPPPELMEAIVKLGEEATRAGALLDTAGLAPSAQGARVELYGGNLSVTDGPFAGPRRGPARPGSRSCCSTRTAGDGTGYSSAGAWQPSA